MNHSLYQDGILKALPFKRLPCSAAAKVCAVANLLQGAIETLRVRQPRSGWKRVVSDSDKV